MPLTRDAAWDGIYRSGRDVRTWPSEDVVRFVARRLKPDSRVLDAGCGNGSNLWHFAALQYQTIGVDCSAEALTQARKLVDRRELASAHLVTLRRGELGQLADIDVVRVGSFDAIVDCRASQHVSWREHAAVYAEYLTLLKPTGWLFLLHLEGGTDDARLDANLEFKQRHDAHTWNDVARGVYPRNGLVCMPPRQDLVALLRSVGFVVARDELLTRDCTEGWSGYESAFAEAHCCHVAIDARPAYTVRQRS